MIAFKIFQKMMLKIGWHYWLPSITIGLKIYAKLIIYLLYGFLDNSTFKILKKLGMKTCLLRKMINYVNLLLALIL